MKSIHHSYTWATAMLFLVVGINVTLVRAQEPAPAQPPAAPKTQEATENAAQKYFTDTVLVDQDGQRLRFYTDLVKNKTVIIDAFFASCTASCLPLNRNLEQIQKALGDRLGKDVYILSISVDPTVDKPPALKAYAKKFNARPGWYFLTGDKANVELVLKKLGQFVEDKNNHTNIFLIGNDRTGLWKKALGLAKSDELIKIVESVLNDPGPDKP